jgi:UDP-N-acetylmuramyl pentapeptide phosphotransferase/UDP-N-acetylglucosamine-1-phosphate transferase
MSWGSLSLLAAALIAAVVSALATGAVRVLAPRLGLVDRANDRSSHVGEIARGGGLGVLVGMVAGSLPFAPPMPVAAWALIVGAALVAVVGLCDDWHRLSPLTRLAAHVAAALIVVVGTGGLAWLPLPRPLDLPLGAAGTALGVLWIVAVVNFYNFLDGIDGLAAVQAVVTGSGVALAGWDPLAALFGACVGGASAGFLVHNWSPARIFLGDVGSGLLGFCFAALPFLAHPRDRSAAVSFVGLSLFLFLADATWTLLLRARRGERLHQAHRQHLYQRLVIAGWSHAQVTALLGFGSLVLTAAALAAWRRREPVWTWAAAGLAVAGFAGELLLARWVARRSDALQES